MQRMPEDEQRPQNDPQLRTSSHALRRAEQDLEKRLAQWVSALEEAGRMHANEPVYQALFFTLGKVRKRRKRMEEELSIRDTAPIV